MERIFKVQRKTALRVVRGLFLLLFLIVLLILSTGPIRSGQVL